MQSHSRLLDWNMKWSRRKSNPIVQLYARIDRRRDCKIFINWLVIVIPRNANSMQWRHKGTKSEGWLNLKTFRSIHPSKDFTFHWKTEKKINFNHSKFQKLFYYFSILLNVRNPSLICMSNAPRRMHMKKKLQLSTTLHFAAPPAP